jgi:hypothetical protein
MERIVIEDIEELYSKVDTLRQVGNKLVADVNSFEFNCPVNFPLELNKLRANHPGIDTSASLFTNCVFNQSVWFKNTALDFYFNDCTFNLINAHDVIFQGKMRFRECNFKKMLSLDNTSFMDLADFWHSTFHEKAVFHKVDFEKTVVFSGSTFKENVLFTYTLFAKLGIFRGTICEKGFDISLSIIEGSLSIFDFELKDYIAIQGELAKMQYESLVHEVGDIPIKNKRETFRILKNIFEKNSDHINSLYYKKLELDTYDNLLKDKIKSKINPWNNKVNRFILWLNFKSNKHGTSFYSGLVFTTIIGIIFFYLSLISTNTYYATLNPFKWSIDTFTESVKYFFISLSPVHKYTYLDSLGPTTPFYIADFAGRIFVSYGIYQTIQAFRKFR